MAVPTAVGPEPAGDSGKLLTLRKISQAFPKPNGSFINILNDLDLQIGMKEIVGLLGRSGSGKSTLLRIVAGLIKPTGGEVLFEDKPIVGPTHGISMVFQNFALFPWLSVLENVELGLEATGVIPVERRKRALKAIDMIGLDGFESAFPKELSGGMRQRVGFARALVVNPDLLLLDEPFSALDVLTAETLRADFTRLWVEGRVPIKSVLMVTHGIEEAVLMCDRAIVFTPNPGRITADIPITLPHPRNRRDPGFRALVEAIYVELMQPPATVSGAVKHVMTLSDHLPGATGNQMIGLLEELGSDHYQGKADLPHLAASLRLKVDELFPIVEALQILGFAELDAGNLVVTPEGQAFARADIQSRKAMFATDLVRRVPLIEHIKTVLDDRPGHRAPIIRFLTELEDRMSNEAAEGTMRIAIGWGRYAELFAYDAGIGMLSLDNPGT